MVGLSKSPFTCPLEHFEGFIFSNSLSSFSFPDSEWKISCTSCKKNLTELSKLHSKCQWGNIGVNLFNRSIVFLILFGNWAKSLGLLTKVLWRSFENYILCVHQGNLRALFQKKLIFHHFWLWVIKFGLFPKKFPRGCQNCILPVHRNSSSGFFKEKSTTLSLSDFVGELFDLFSNSFGGVVKFCNCVSIETVRERKFPEKRSFSKKAEVQRKFFGNCRMNEWISAGLSNCIPSAH